MKIKNLPYKTKNKLLLGGSLAFLLLVYHLVVSKTVDLYSVNKQLTKELSEGISAPEKKKVLEQRLEVFDQRLNRYFCDSVKNREYILGIISAFCHKNSLILKDYPESIVTDEKGFHIETNVVEAEGGFINLLKLVHYLESEMRIARPASVNFETKLDSRTRREILTVKIHLQNIRKKNDENVNL